jgi:outer membrane biogenesis lipoprotein LolB
MSGRTIHLSAVVLGALFLLYSCSPAPRFILDTERVTYAQLVRNAQVNHQKKNSLHATGSISIESTDFTNSGNFTMNLKHPDSLLVRLRGPFGIAVGTVFLSRHDFVFYNGMANQAIVGEPRNDILRAFLRMDVGVDDVMDMFLGSSQRLFHEVRSPDEYRVDGDQYLLIFRSYDSVRRYWIDPAYRCVSRMVLSDTNDKPVYEERYDRFTETDGIVMARSIRVISHTERASFSISYNRMDLNARDLSFAYSIPNSATIIDWKEQ